MSPSPDQDRRPPRERLAIPEAVLDLHAIASSLRTESTPARHGHRQITVFHKPPLTLIVFDFEAGGRLADHHADAQVTIMAVTGLLEVSTSRGTHRLPAGSLIVLDPNVIHSVQAHVPSQMLLVVSRSTDTEPVNAAATLEAPPPSRDPADAELQIGTPPPSRMSTA